VTTDHASILRIAVRIQVGEHLMSASDDPLFLGLRGASGREFRLRLNRGRSLRRGKQDHFVIGAPDDPETNLAEPTLNDPTNPPLALSEVTGAYLRKGLDPIPNVRGRGEMDDRLEVEEAQVEIQPRGGTPALRFQRRGPIWLGLEAGLLFELPRTDSGA
jgi:hypothetical protein